MTTLLARVQVSRGTAGNGHFTWRGISSGSGPAPGAQSSSCPRPADVLYHSGEGSPTDWQRTRLRSPGGTAQHLPSTVLWIEKSRCSGDETGLLYKAMRTRNQVLTASLDESAGKQLEEASLPFSLGPGNCSMIDCCFLARVIVGMFATTSKDASSTCSQADSSSRGRQLPKLLFAALAGAAILWSGMFYSVQR